MKLAASAVTLLALCGLAQLIFGGGYSEELKLFDYFKQDAVSGKGGGIPPFPSAKTLFHISFTVRPKTRRGGAFLAAPSP